MLEKLERGYQIICMKMNSVTYLTYPGQPYLERRILRQTVTALERLKLIEPIVDINTQTVFVIRNTGREALHE